MKKSLICFAFFAAVSGSAQTGSSVFNFLNIPTAPRQAALGGDAISVRDYDADFSAVNPALMNAEMDKMISLNFASYLADAKIGSANAVKDLGAGHLASLNLKYLDYGNMPRTDEYGNQHGSFGAMDAAVGLGYAFQFEDNWTVGANVNYITSKIDQFSSSALSLNTGISYHHAQRKETASLVLRNIGAQIKTYNGQREDLPFRIDIGYTRILPEFPVAVTVTAHDLQQFNISSPVRNDGQEVNFMRKITDHLSLGAELFPEQSFNLRLGYNVRRGGELAVEDQRSFTGLSAGFGIKISSFRFDYAHVRYHNSSNVNLFGISLDLYQLNGDRR